MCLWFSIKIIDNRKWPPSLVQETRYLVTLALCVTPFLRPSFIWNKFLCFHHNKNKKNKKTMFSVSAIFSVSVSLDIDSILFPIMVSSATAHSKVYQYVRFFAAKMTGSFACAEV